MNMAQKKTAAANTAPKTVKESVRETTPLLAVTETKRPAAAPKTKIAEVPKAKIAVAAPKAPVARKAKTAPHQNAYAAGVEFGDLETVGQETFEACVKCGTIAAKGVETLGNEVMTFTQANIEADLAAAKDILAAKTLNEAIDLQTGFVQARLERMTNETAKLSELSMHFASQALEPLRSRFDAHARTAFRSFGQ
jgi:phasin family protein